MDSRNDVYGEQLYIEYTRAMMGGAALEQYLKKYEIDFLLLTYVQDRSGALYSYLDESPEWTLTYFDDRYVIYLKEIPRYQEILRRDGYRLISPARADAVEMRTEDANEWLAEATHAVKAAPRAWSPLQYLAKAYMLMQRAPEAIQTTEALLRIYPEGFFAWNDLANLQLQQGRKDLAEQAFVSCLQTQPGYRPCQEGLMRLRGRP
jgi:tetratricopeptide (TPR) repeat protein